MSEFLTILTNLPNKYGITQPATKTLSRSEDGKWLKSKQYSLGRMFYYSVIPVSDIFSLLKALVRTSHDQSSFFIRGKLRDNVDSSQPVYRRSNSSNGDTAHFEEVPRHWAMFDFDKVSVSEWNDLYDDPESAVEDLIYRHLPKIFHDVTCVWQLSSGAATVDPEATLSLHLWFWLDRPMGQDELTLFHAVHAPTVDRAVFRTVQPLYTAAPVFTAPHCDPLPRRVGLMQREYDCLTLPSIDVAALEGKTPKGKGTGLVGHVHGFEAKLKLLGDGPGRSGFNSVIPAAIAAYIYKRHQHEIDEEAIKSYIRSAIDDAPASINRSQQDLIRYKSDQYLGECIRTAVDKFCQQPVPPLYPSPNMSVLDVRKQFSRDLRAFVDAEARRLAA
jgi:hypothetical protein